MRGDEPITIGEEADDSGLAPHAWDEPKADQTALDAMELAPHAWG